MSAYKTVFFIIGILLIILGLFMLVPYGVQIFYQENSHSFLASSFVTILIGGLLVLANLQEKNELSLKQTFLFTTFSWLSIAIFGSIPFLLANIEVSISDAFFESMSGITTTGSTIHNKFR